MNELIIYHYRSGFLAKDVERKVLDHYKQYGYSAVRAADRNEFSNLSLTAGFSRTIVSIDLGSPKAKNDGTLNGWDAALASLLNDGPNSALLLVPAGSKIVSCTNWPAVQEQAWTVEEPAITPLSIKSILRDLICLVSCYPFYKFANVEKLFDAVVADCSSNIPDLPGLFHALKFKAVTCMDTALPRFNFAEAESAARQRGLSLPFALRSYLNDVSEQNLSSLVKLLGDRLRAEGYSGPDACVELIRATEKLLHGTTIGFGGSKATSGMELPGASTSIAWAIFLLGRERELADSRSFLGALDRLLRDFSTIAPAAGRSRLIRSMGSLVVSSLMDGARQPGRLATARGRLHASLSTALEALPDPMILDARLSRLIQVALPARLEAEAREREARAAEDEGSRSAPQPNEGGVFNLDVELVLGFEDISGSPNAIAQLRTRILTGEHKSPLLIEGPVGSGRETIIRLYVQALQCERPAPSGSPCRECRCCTEFRPRIGQIGFYEYRFSDSPTAADLRDDIAEAGRLLSFYPWKVFVFFNAEKAEGGALSPLLKKMEEQQEGWTFVLSTTDSRHLAGPIVSRCEIHRLGRMTATESRAFVARLCELHNIALPADVKGLLSSVGRGLVGDTQRAFESVLKSNARTLVEAKDVLDTNWAGTAAGDWERVTASSQVNFSPSSVEPTERLRRLRTLARELHAQALSDSPPKKSNDPALALLDAEGWAKLANPLAVRASAEGRSVSEIWDSVAEHWIQCQPTEEIGLAYEMDLSRVGFATDLQFSARSGQEAAAAGRDTRV